VPFDCYLLVELCKRLAPSMPPVLGCATLPCMYVNCAIEPVKVWNYSRAAWRCHSIRVGRYQRRGKTRSREECREQVRGTHTDLQHCQQPHRHGVRHKLADDQAASCLHAFLSKGVCNLFSACRGHHLRHRAHMAGSLSRAELPCNGRGESSVNASSWGELEQRQPS